MKSEHIISLAILIGATSAMNSGCMAHGQAGGYVEADAPVAFAEAPTLVSVDSNVWVVRDYDYAVYYFDTYYWVARDGKWHRSRSYDGGWIVVEESVVPSTIVHRDHHAYVHFHGAATAETRLAPRENLAAETRRGPPEHAAEQHGGPPGQDNKDKDDRDHRVGPPQGGDHNDRAEKDRSPGPPEHAAEQHGGPPGQNDAPGVRDEHRDGSAPNASRKGDNAPKKDERDKRKKK